MPIKIEKCLWLLTEGSRLPFTRIGGVPQSVEYRFYLVCRPIMLTLSEERKFHLIFAQGRQFSVWNFRSRERKYVGTKVLLPHIAYRSKHTLKKISDNWATRNFTLTVILLRRYLRSETYSSHRQRTVDFNTRHFSPNTADK